MCLTISSSWYNVHMSGMKTIQLIKILIYCILEYNVIKITACRYVILCDMLNAYDRSCIKHVKSFR